MEKIFFCQKRDCCPFLETTQEGIYITDDSNNKIFLTKDNVADLYSFLLYNKKEILDETFYEKKEIII